MEFLVQTEENLAVEISGNYQSLVEQQKTHEVSIPSPRRTQKQLLVLFIHSQIVVF